MSHFVHISSTLVDSLSNCLVVQLLTVNIRISAIFVSTGRKMHSGCVDSNVDNVLLQTSICRFLSSLIFLNKVPQTRCIALQMLSNRLITAVKGYVSEMIRFTDVFLFFFSYCICSVSPGNAATDVR